MTAELKRLWMEAFGDSAETVDKFFATGFSPERCRYICKDGVPVSALYWFDCFLGDRKIAYIYAVATAGNHRGKGLASSLLTDTHRHLQETGYAGAILVPGEQSLFALYERLGYRTATSVREFTCQAGNAPVSITEVDATQYAALRKDFLPPEGVVQEKETLAYLQTYASFYKGSDFLLAAAQVGDTLVAQELLGNAETAPGILRTLGLPQGQFRTPGNGRAFAMFLQFSPQCPIPGYFGLALD